MTKLHRLPIIYDIPKDVNIVNAFHERQNKFDNPWDEFIDICLNNLTWAARHLLMWRGKPLQLAPFQSVIIETLWNKTFPILLASRGAGKTFLLAVYASLRAMLSPGSKIVIVAASFRQSKLVFDYIEQLYNYSPIFRAACGNIKKPSDQVYVEVGDSVIRALPLGNGEKIRGIRACVAADTLIDTKGGLIPAKEVVDAGKDFAIYNSEKFEIPSSYCRTNLTNVHSIETTYGYSVEFSDIHKIYTDEGWKDIEQLTINDRIRLCSSKKFTDSFVKINKRCVEREVKKDYDVPGFIEQNVAKILGYLVSEGCVTNKNGTISFTNTDRSIIDDYCETFNNAFGVTPAIYEKSGYLNKRGWKCKKSYEAKICRKGIRQFLEDAGLYYEKALNKEIPWSILRSPRCIVVEFLRALYEGNGTTCLYKNKKRNSDEFYVAYYSASKQLCGQLQTLMLKFGLVGSFSERKTGNRNYCLRFNRGYAASFARDIGFISEQKQLVCNRALQVFDPKYYDGKSIKIKKVNKCIRKDVLYDVCMPETHRFVGNGILNHNTNIITDEFASINPEIFQVVVRGFASVAANPIEAAKRVHDERKAIEQGRLHPSQITRDMGNQIIYSGTANYQFNHFYKLWQTHKAIIQNKIVGNAQEVNERLALEEEDALSEGYLDYKDYAIIQLPYQGLPEGYMDEKQIAQAKVTMPRALFEMEYECKFPADSDGFFKRSYINAVTPGSEHCPGKAFSVETKAVPGFEYVMGIDPARKTDNFAISVLKLYPETKTYRNVYCYSMRGKRFPAATRIVRDLLKKFNVVRVAMDAGGGGRAVEDLLQDEKQLEPGEQLVWRYDEDEHRKYAGEHILDMVDFTSKWIGEANYGLASDIEHGNLLFPYRALEVENTSKDADLIKDEVWDEIEEQIKEMCMIVVTPTKTGIQHFDMPELPASQQSTLKTYQRKDRYSALLLSAYAARTYFQEEKKTIQPCTGGWVELL